jgi:hypothetical protein
LVSCRFCFTRRSTQILCTLRRIVCLRVYLTHANCAHCRAARRNRMLTRLSLQFQRCINASISRGAYCHRQFRYGFVIRHLRNLFFARTLGTHRFFD